MLQDMVTDDRPPSSLKPFYVELNAKAAAIVEKYKNTQPKHYTRSEPKA